MIMYTVTMRDSKGHFIKGHSGYWAGKHMPDSTKQKLSELFKKRIKEKNPNWKGGRIKSGRYICLYMPEHPNCDVKGYVKEHRYVMEQIIGRLLEKTESVHHKDGNKYNNLPDNLELLSWRDHALLHKNWKHRKNLN